MATNFHPSSVWYLGSRHNTEFRITLLLWLSKWTNSLFLTGSSYAQSYLYDCLYLSGGAVFAFQVPLHVSLALWPKHNRHLVDTMSYCLFPAPSFFPHSSTPTTHLVVHKLHYSEVMEKSDQCGFWYESHHHHPPPHPCQRKKAIKFQQKSDRIV